VVGIDRGDRSAEIGQGEMREVESSGSHPLIATSLLSPPFSVDLAMRSTNGDNSL